MYMYKMHTMHSKRTVTTAGGTSWMNEYAEQLFLLELTNAVYVEWQVLYVYIHISSTTASYHDNLLQRAL